MSTVSHSHYMSLALELARQGCCTVSPNPMVGCVLVKNKQIIGQGFHKHAGECHAEIYALQEAGFQSQGATVYLTLEPCCHYGKTSPCTHALIRAGIKKVYVACLDPNPINCGKGVKELISANIEVEIGLCEDEAKQLNEIFFHYITKRRPFIIAKWAMSLDGKTIVNQEDSPQISCPESQHHVHQIRQQVDAVLIGSNTARIDNPQLTARFPSADTILKQPIRIILSSRYQLSLNLKMFESGKTIIATTETVTGYKFLQSNKVEIVVLPKNKYGKICLINLLDELGRREITSVLVEGGRTVHEAFFKENLVNKIHVYLSPTIIGSLKEKQTLRNVDSTKLGSDFYFTTHYDGDPHV